MTFVPLVRLPGQVLQLVRSFHMIRQISVTKGVVYCLFIPQGSSLRAEAPRAERKREPRSVSKLMWAESMISRVKVKWPNFGHRLFPVTLQKTHRHGKKGLSLQ